MSEKHTYDFYYKISNEAENNANDYVKLSYERDLPLSDDEYNIAAVKLIDSVANHANVNKDHITPVSREEFINKTNENLEE